MPEPDASLIDTGILDSVAVLTLFAFIEKQFDITISDGEATPSNFESISRITNFVDSKLKTPS